MTTISRTLRNPARAKPPTDDQIARMDEEVKVGLGNIKRPVEECSRQSYFFFDLS